MKEAGIVHGGLRKDLEYSYSTLDMSGKRALCGEMCLNVGFKIDFHFLVFFSINLVYSPHCMYKYVYKKAARTVLCDAETWIMRAKKMK